MGGHKGNKRNGGKQRRAEYMRRRQNRLRQPPMSPRPGPAASGSGGRVVRQDRQAEPELKEAAKEMIEQPIPSIPSMPPIPNVHQRSAETPAVGSASESDAHRSRRGARTRRTASESVETVALAGQMALAAQSAAQVDRSADTSPVADAPGTSGPRRRRVKPAAPAAAELGVEETLVQPASSHLHSAPHKQESQSHSREVAADDPQITSLRPPRRTRTLADIVHPARPAGMRFDDPGDSAPRPAAPGADAGPISGGRIPTPTLSTARKEPPATLGQMAATLVRRVPAPATRPIAPADPPISGARPRPPETRPISVPVAQPEAPSQMRPSLKPRPIPTPADSRASAALPRLPRNSSRRDQGKRVRETPLRRFLYAIQRGDIRLILRMALGHVLTGLLAALAASALLLAGNDQGYWLLGLAALALPGGVTAYTLLSGKRAAVPGSLALVGAQLAALAWAYALIGPQLSLLMLLPAALWLALLMGGRLPALVCGLGGLVIYFAFQVAVALDVYRPTVSLDPRAQLLFDGLVTSLGVALALLAFLYAAAARQRSAAAARARLYELRLVREEMASLRERTEQDGQKLEEALAEALRGRGLDLVTADGSLSPVAEAVNAAAERLATLQKDREDRLRLEGALRTLIRTVERGWLGLSWSWPEPSNTLLDELVALLRAPRPQERRGLSPAWSDDVPTFLMLPTVGNSSQTPPSVPVPPPSAGAVPDDTPKPRPGWNDLLSR
jgi:hypothetical protein